MEHEFGHGALRSNPISHAIRNWRREKAGAVAPFDWSQGYDSLSMIPPVLIKNQFKSESCGGQSVSYALEIIEKLANNQEGSISAKSIYAPRAAVGGGMFVSDLQRQITSSGASLEVLVPSYKPDATTDEPFMQDKTTLRPQDALKRNGYRIVNVPITMDDIASAIKQYGAVIWEITGQNNGTWLSPLPQPPVSNNNLWTHFMCCVGADQSTGFQKIKALQSWGLNCGERGVQYFQANYINSGYVLDCFAFYKPTVTVETSAQISNWQQFWANVNAWWNGQPFPYPSVPVGSFRYWYQNT